MNPPMFPAHCKAFSDKRAAVVLVDPKGGPSEFRGENDSKKLITVYRVDGCCIKQSESKACDYLLLVEESDAWLIELKGSDLAGGIQQMEAVMKVFEEKLRPRRIHVRIVPSKVRAPDTIASTEFRLRKRLRAVEGTYKCQTRVMKEKL